jgi:hypothetical protein
MTVSTVTLVRHATIAHLGKIALTAMHVPRAMTVSTVMHVPRAMTEHREPIASTAIHAQRAMTVRRATRTSTPVVTNALSLSFRRMT